MNKFEKHYQQEKDKYFLKAGRVVCYNDLELFSINRIDSGVNNFDMTPCHADAMAHFIVDALNKGDFQKYYSEYINS